MNNARTKLGNSLFALAKKVYPAGKDKNPLMKELGDMLFKLAAEVSPDKAEPAKKARAHPVKTAAKKTAAPVKKAVKKAKSSTLAITGKK